MPITPPLPCPLCATTKTTLFHEDKTRRYLRCSHCSLIFVPVEYHLNEEDEKARYDLHENDPNDEGYRKFVGRLFEAMAPELTEGSSGLDFGSGPCPVLAMIFGDAGFEMSLYDKYYAPDEAVLEKSYDFIISTETVEHLSRPREDLDRLWACLKPGGLLGIMTSRLSNLATFANWHYIRDNTHVSFFSDETFRHLAYCWGAELRVLSPDIVLLGVGSQERGGLSMINPL